MNIFMKSSFYLRLLPVSILLIFSALIFSASGVMADVTKKTVAVADGNPSIVKNQPLKKSEQEKILGRIRHKYSQKESFSGRFTQKTTYTDSNETTLSMGKIWIQGPDKMRWEYQLPEKQMLISDGKTIWYYTPDLNQVMIGKVEDIKEARVLVNLLAKLKSEQKGFKLDLTRTEKEITVALLPLSDDNAPPFQSMEMIFSASDLTLKETRMEDLFANKIVITYKWVSGSDSNLPGVKFSFIPPAGCDIMPLGE